MSTQPAANPFEYWQQTMSRWMPTACTPNDKPTATLEPFAFSQMMQNPFMAGVQMWQQSMAAWQGMMQPKQPESPKVSLMTVDLGDMKPYVDMSMQMMQQWQQMWMQGMKK